MTSKPSLGLRIRIFVHMLGEMFYGMTVYEMVRDLKKERGMIERLFILVVFARMLGGLENALEITAQALAGSWWLPPKRAFALSQRPTRSRSSWLSAPSCLLLVFHLQSAKHHHLWRL